MNTKKYLVVPLIALLFVGLMFVSGCSKKTTETTGSAFAGGSRGLDVSFISGAPPKEVFEKTGFPISISIENKGESDVTDAKLYIGGIDVNSFNITQTLPVSVPILTAVRKSGTTITPGTPQIVTLTSEGYQYDIPGDTDFTMIARVCYPYSTNAIAKACLKENIVKQSIGSEVCEVSGSLNSESSGGPIKITSVKEVPMGESKVGFQITVENVGGGTPYIGTDCQNLEFTALNKLIGISGTIAGTAIDCNTGDDTTSDSGEVYLADGKATILFCSYDITGVTSAVEETLTITTTYNYLSEAKQSFTVRNIG